MSGLEAARKTTILFKLTVTEMVTTIATTRFNVRLCGVQELYFHRVAVRGLDKFRPQCHHYCQDANGLIYVVVINDRDRVEEAKLKLNKIVNEDEMRDAAVLAFANTLTPSTTTRLRKSSPS